MPNRWQEHVFVCHVLQVSVSFFECQDGALLHIKACLSESPWRVVFQMNPHELLTVSLLNKLSS